MMKYTIGIDIGGTNIRVALMDETLHIIHKEVTYTKEIKDLQNFLETIRAMIKTVDPKMQAETIGIVFPAPWTSNQNCILDATNTLFLENLQIKQLKEAFINYRLYIENDVNVIALLEANKGAAINTNHSFYTTVSTGIGSGVIINNQIYHGANGYAGEIGSIILSKSSEITDDPLKGSLEQLCSGKALEEKSQLLYGSHATARELFLAFEQGMPDAAEVVENWLDDITRGLAAVIQITNPEVVVMGGPVILNHKWVIKEIEKEVKKKVFGRLAEKVRIVEAKYGIDAGLIGAGYYAFVREEMIKQSVK